MVGLISALLQVMITDIKKGKSQIIVLPFAKTGLTKMLPGSILLFIKFGLSIKQNTIYETYKNINRFNQK